MEGDVYKNDNLNKKADKIKSCEDKIGIVKEYYSIIKLDSKEKLLNYRRNCTIRRLNKYKNFLDTVTNLCIIKSVIKFKINLLNRQISIESLNICH